MNVKPFRKYDPANPQRAKSISKRKWDTFKPKIAFWHSKGATKGQILDMLSIDADAIFFDFQPSIDQLVARMKAWNLTVDNRGAPLRSHDASHAAHQDHTTSSQPQIIEHNEQPSNHDSTSPVIDKSPRETDSMTLNNGRRRTNQLTAEFPSAMKAHDEVKDQAPHRSMRDLNSPNFSSVGIEPIASADSLCKVSSTTSSAISVSSCGDEKPDSEPDNRANIRLKNILNNLGATKLSEADQSIPIPAIDRYFSNSGLYSCSSRVIENRKIPVLRSFPTSCTSLVMDQLDEISQAAEFLFAAHCYQDAFDLHHVCFKHWYTAMEYNPSLLGTRRFFGAAINCARSCVVSTQSTEVERILEHLIDLFSSCGKKNSLDCLLLNLYLVVIKHSTELPVVQSLRSIFGARIPTADFLVIAQQVQSSCRANPNMRFDYIGSDLHQREFLFLTKCMQEIELRLNAIILANRQMKEHARDVSQHFPKCSTLINFMQTLLKTSRAIFQGHADAFDILLCICECGSSVSIRTGAQRALLSCLTEKILNYDDFPSPNSQQDSECERLGCPQSFGLFACLAGIVNGLFHEESASTLFDATKNLVPVCVQKIEAISSNTRAFIGQFCQNYQLQELYPACIRRNKLQALALENMQICVRAALGEKDLLWEYFDEYGFDRFPFETAESRAGFWPLSSRKVDMVGVRSGVTSSNPSYKSSRSASSFEKFVQYASKINGWPSGSTRNKNTSGSSSGGAAMSFVSINSSDGGNITIPTWASPKLGISIKSLMESSDIDDGELEDILMEMD